VIKRRFLKSRMANFKIADGKAGLPEVTKWSLPPRLPQVKLIAIWSALMVKLSSERKRDVAHDGQQSRIKDFQGGPGATGA
jgi:hypothetical protein